MPTFPDFESCKSILSKKRPYSAWKNAAPRLAPEVWPACVPSFTLEPGAKVFTIGSCFARSIEDYLDLIDFDVPTLGFEAPESENPLGPTFLLNKYTPPTVYQELAWAARILARDDTVREDDVKDHVYRLPDGRVLDLQLSLSPVSYERFFERRRDVYRVFSQAFTSDCVAITLGLVEAWYDEQSGLFLKEVSRSREMRQSERFGFVELTFEDCLGYVEDTVSLLRDLNPSCKILITTSPVPMARTFTDRDVVTANTYSKSLLRVVSETVARKTPDMDYFPSYEAVMLSPSWCVLEEDRRHVQPGFAARIVQHLVKHYVGDIRADQETFLSAALALASGAEPRHAVYAALDLLQPLSERSISQLVLLARVCHVLEEDEQVKRVADELTRRPNVPSRHLNVVSAATASKRPD